MTNRRQFLGIGIAAAVWPGLMTAAQRSSVTRAPAEGPARRPLYKAIVDTAYAPALEFAAQMRRSGVAIHAIERDITSVWFNDLALRWRGSPAAVAGLTAPEALFCLEQLAWDHRMRVVLRRRVEDSLAVGPGWGASMADLAIHYRQNQTPNAADRTTGARGSGAKGLPLVSWVIAPVDRT